MIGKLGACKSDIFTIRYAAIFSGAAILAYFPDLKDKEVFYVNRPI